PLSSASHHFLIFFLDWADPGRSTERVSHISSASQAQPIRGGRLRHRRRAARGMPMPRTTPSAGRVLVVEDNDDVRESLCLLLSLSGYEVRKAADGAEGVRQALEWQPDAVVSDIGLPGLDGWELGRRVRAGLGRAVLLVADPSPDAGDAAATVP